MLLTGFGPFASFETNCTQIIAERLDHAVIRNAQIHSVVAPVEFGQDVALLIPAIEQLKPEIVVSLGMDARAECMYIEEIAGNHKEDPQTGELLPIIKDAPRFLDANWDVPRIVRALNDAGYFSKSRRSENSTYLCNHIFYQALYHKLETGNSYQCGFVHIPIPTDMGGTICRLTTEQFVSAVTVVIEQALQS